jgi:hypothetical protein
LEVEEELNANIGLQHIHHEIDKELKVLGKVRQPVPGDGHCIIYSWSKALVRDSVNRNMHEGRKH